MTCVSLKILAFSRRKILHSSISYWTVRIGEEGDEQRAFGKKEKMNGDGVEKLEEIQVKRFQNRQVFGNRCLKNGKRIITVHVDIT